MKNNVIITKSCTIENETFSDWSNSSIDGLKIDGEFDENLTVHVNNCTFTRENLDPAEADELCSVICGGKAYFNNCVFKCSGKGVLIGTGSDNELDKDTIYVEFHNCIFEDLSRRHPYVNAGTVKLFNCTIKNWGKDQYFHEKSAGVRGGSDAKIELYNCKFEQESFWTCFRRKNKWKDIFNQYLFPFLYFGFMRGAYAEKGGKIKIENCTKNHWWIILRETK